MLRLCRGGWGYWGFVGGEEGGVLVGLGRCVESLFFFLVCWGK